MMVPMSRYALMGGTVAAAVGIGFFMQQSPTAQARYGDGVEVASLAPALPEGALRPDAIDSLPLSVPENDETVAAPVPLSAVISAEEAPLPPVENIEMAAAGPGEPAPAAPLSEPERACDATMTAVPKAAAMVYLALASCQPGARVTIHHNGMMVQGVTDAKGALEMTLPALAAQALYIAEFPNRDGAVAQAVVEGFTDFDRIVLQWRGAAGFLLSAQEFGAAFGEAGHRDRDAPGTLDDVVAGASGVVTQHGDAALPDGLRAEAYTFPRGVAKQSGTIALSVEAQVTAENCGKDIAAQSLQLIAGDGLEVRELTLGMPDCDAVGDYIVLKNMAEDLKIAAN